MKARLFVLVSSIALVICSSVFGAGWKTPVRINNSYTAGMQCARSGEPGWGICIDDKNNIKITWESNPSAILDQAEVNYRQGTLRGDWGVENDTITVNDPGSSNPGHPSCTWYKIQNRYFTLIGYSSQTYSGLSHSEYKGILFNDSSGAMVLPFRFLSEPNGKAIPYGDVGQKSGTLINNGSNKIFAAWPYIDTVGSIQCYRIWYRIIDAEGDSSTESRVDTTQVPLWQRDVCLYPDPNHDMHIIYSSSTNYGDTTDNIFHSKFNFTGDLAGYFEEPEALTQVSEGTKAIRPYIVSQDIGGGDYKLHAVWQEGPDANGSVIYQKWSSNSWSPSFTIADNGACFPTVAVTQDGDVYVAWEQRSSSDTMIFWRMHWADSSENRWSVSDSLPDTTIDTTRVVSRYLLPLMVTDHVGNLHMVFDGLSDSTGDDVFYTFYDLPPISPKIIEPINMLNNHPRFKWSPCTETNFSQYNIYRRRFLEDTCALVIATKTSKNDTIFTDTQINIGTPNNDTAFYYVTACDSIPQESKPSPTLAFTYFHKGPKIYAWLLPVEFSLSQNYPNPFNPDTKIDYALPEPAHVALDIYDMLGRKVTSLVNEDKNPGYHQAIWNARDNPSGMYFYRLKAGSFTETKKMVLMK